MGWEAVTAVSTAAGTLVILITVIIAVHQLRQLRRATQLDGMMRLFDELDNPKLLKAIEHVRHITPTRMRDENYWVELDTAHVQHEAVPEYIVLRWLEKVGTLAKHGLIDPTTLYALNMPDYLALWVVLSVVVERMRRRSRAGFKAFDNAEYLCTESERWAECAWGREVLNRLKDGYRSQIPHSIDARQDLR